MRRSEAGVPFWQSLRRAAALRRPPAGGLQAIRLLLFSPSGNTANPPRSCARRGERPSRKGVRLALGAHPSRRVSPAAPGTRAGGVGPGALGAGPDPRVLGHTGAADGRISGLPSKFKTSATCWSGVRMTRAPQWGAAPVRRGAGGAACARRTPSWRSGRDTTAVRSDARCAQADPGALAARSRCGRDVLPQCHETRDTDPGFRLEACCIAPTILNRPAIHGRRRTRVRRLRPPLAIVRALQYLEAPPSRLRGDRPSRSAARVLHRGGSARTEAGRSGVTNKSRMALHGMGIPIRGERLCGSQGAAMKQQCDRQSRMFGPSGYCGLEPWVVAKARDRRRDHWSPRNSL